MSGASIGFGLAGATAVFNAVADVALKNAVRGVAIVAVTFWTRLAGALAMVLVFGTWVGYGHPVHIRDGGPIFGIPFLHASPNVTFLLYSTTESIILCLAALLQFRAYQLSPISLCVPYISFTPVFLIFTGWLFLNELPAPAKIAGIVVIVAGSFGMHRQLFARSPWEPLRAALQERGSRYMLLFAFLLALTNPIDKRLVLMSDPIVQTFSYMVLSTLVFGLLLLRERDTALHALRTNGRWLLASGLLQTFDLVLQFASLTFVAVVIAISIKRCSIVLTVLLGWLVFKERQIRDKLVASAVMLTGVLLIYLNIDVEAAYVIAAFAIVALGSYIFVVNRASAVDEARP